jgi:hypothetical protein
MNRRSDRGERGAADGRALVRAARCKPRLPIEAAVEILDRAQCRKDRYVSLGALAGEVGPAWCVALFWLDRARKTARRCATWTNALKRCRGSCDTAGQRAGAGLLRSAPKVGVVDPLVARQQLRV